jgi:hypothetical protein
MAVTTMVTGAGTGIMTMDSPDAGAKAMLIK